jgi:hypothetical protein
MNAYDRSETTALLNGPAHAGVIARIMKKRSFDKVERTIIFERSVAIPDGST